MKTPDMIENLSKDLKPTTTHFYRNSLLLWSAGTTALLVVFFFIIPLRADLGLRFASIFFRGETLVLLSLFFAATWIAYRSAIPGLLGPREQTVALVLVGVFAIFILSKLSLSAFRAEFLGEMDFYRGRCGPILLALAGSQTLLGLVLARRAAPTNLVRTGAWLGLSAGALALLATQFICDHENFLHVLIWHALPTGLIVAGAAIAGRRLLRW